MSKLAFTTEELGPRFSEIVFEELNPHFSRITAKIPAQEKKLEVGTVLTQSKTGGYEPYQGAGTPGGILITEILPSEDEQEAVIIVRDAILNAENLIFDAAVTDKAKACAALEEAGLILRNMPEEEPEEESEESKKEGDQNGAAE